jgi:magnesium chelatase family protein
VEGIVVIPVPDLAALLAHLRGTQRLPTYHLRAAAPTDRDPLCELDFCDVHGQQTAKRALEIAAAGAHNAIMIGPPGAGKSMLARRLPGILPPMTQMEAIEATKVHSVAGTLRSGQALLAARPFRAPHHSVSEAGIIGGGNPPRPGEVSLAHHGVLFLDEVPQLQRHVLESLRQPLEDGVVNIGRAGVALSYPARFMLVAAMNPCPCGWFGAGTCVCKPHEVQRYASRISGPLLDRIDLHIHVDRVDGSVLRSNGNVNETSATVRHRVTDARARQQQRAGKANAALTDRELRKHCTLDDGAERRLRDAEKRLGLSARSLHRVIRVARTVADLAGRDRITRTDISEVLGHRSLDRSLALR